MRFRTVLVANSVILARIYHCLTRRQSRYLGLPLALTCFNLKRRNLAANSPLQGRFAGVWNCSCKIWKLGQGSLRPFGIPFHPKVETMNQGPSNTTNKRVLIVDDDTEIVDTVRFALESKGYTVLVARDGNQGIALYERDTPDLVILDMMMPKRSGFLVLEKLKKEYEQTAKVIMITANEGSRHKAYAEMLGVNDYIRKPFAMDRLLESVEKLLSQEK